MALAGLTAWTLIPAIALRSAVDARHPCTPRSGLSGHIEMSCIVHFICEAWVRCVKL